MGSGLSGTRAVSQWVLFAPLAGLDQSSVQPRGGSPNHIDLKQQPCSVTLLLLFRIHPKIQGAEMVLASCSGRTGATTSPVALPKATGTSELSLKCMAGAGNGSASKDGHLQECSPGEDRWLEADRDRQHCSICFTPKPISYLLYRSLSIAKT